MTVTEIYLVLLFLDSRRLLFGYGILDLPDQVFILLRWKTLILRGGHLDELDRSLRGLQGLAVFLQLEQDIREQVIVIVIGRERDGFPGGFLGAVKVGALPVPKRSITRECDLIASVVLDEFRAIDGQSLVCFF